MKRVAWNLGLAAVAATIVVAATAPREPVDPASREVRRIQAHLLGAERMMLARDVSGLSADQRAARETLIRELREYRRAGVFPKNRDFPTERRPYFIDAGGIRCAMAYLIERHGGAALVTRVAHQRNNAYVRELADEPELIAWLDRNGMTAAEAARVQPGYSQLPPSDYVAYDSGDRTILVSTSLALESVGILANLERGKTPGGRAGRAIFGAVTSGIGMAAGFSVVGDQQVSDVTRQWGAVTIAIGGVGMILAIRQARPDPPSHSNAPVEATLWRSQDGAPGLAVRVHY